MPSARTGSPLAVGTSLCYFHGSCGGQLLPAPEVASCATGGSGLSRQLVSAQGRAIATGEVLSSNVVQLVATG